MITKDVCSIGSSRGSQNTVVFPPKFVVYVPDFKRYWVGSGSLAANSEDGSVYTEETFLEFDPVWRLERVAKGYLVLEEVK
jgi:hypothetical protein